MVLLLLLMYAQLDGHIWTDGLDNITIKRVLTCREIYIHYNGPSMSCI